MPLRTPDQAFANRLLCRVETSIAAIVLMSVLAGGSCSRSSRTKSTKVVLDAGSRHVLVISVDGLSAEFLAKQLQEGQLSNIARLKSEGSYAEGVTGTYPSLTAPAHATMVTGRLPAAHGIYTSRSYQEGNEKGRAWTAKDLQVPALWNRLNEAGLTSAAISWPVAIGAPITWNLTGALDTTKGEEDFLQRLARWASPRMMAETLAGLSEVALGTGTDTLRTHLAIALIREYKPNLLLLRFPSLDEAQHHAGCASPTAVATLKQVDGYVGELLTAIRESGLGDTTDVFIVSDHGFASVQLSVQPNVLLAKAGLLTVNKEGRIAGGKIRVVENDGNLFLYWSNSENLNARVKEALRPLQERGLIQAILERDDLAKLGADPRAQMALEAPMGTIFEEDAYGDLIRKFQKPHGAHGYLPMLPQMQAVFIAAGPGIKAGVNLHRIQMTAIAPTILKALGIADSNFGVHLAVFNPGCCSEIRPISSGVGTSGAVQTRP